MIKMNLDRLMYEKGYSSRQLEEKTKVPRQAISRYRSNTFISINREHLEAFLKEFNCNISDLITVEGKSINKQEENTEKIILAEEINKKIEAIIDARIKAYMIKIKRSIIEALLNMDD